MRIDSLIGSPPEKEQSTGSVRNGAAAREFIQKPNPKKWKANQK
jgi:hypothetical protein